MKTLECSHATGAHDEACDLVAGLTREVVGLMARVDELTRCLGTERCSVCGQRYNIDPATGMGCRLADHIEAYAAIVGKVC